MPVPMTAIRSLSLLRGMMIGRALSFRLKGGYGEKLLTDHVCPLVIRDPVSAVELACMPPPPLSNLASRRASFCSPALRRPRPGKDWGVGGVSEVPNSGGPCVADPRHRAATGPCCLRSAFRVFRTSAEIVSAALSAATPPWPRSWRRRRCWRFGARPINSIRRVRRRLPGFSRSPAICGLTRCAAGASPCRSPIHRTSPRPCRWRTGSSPRSNAISACGLRWKRCGRNNRKPCGWPSSRSGRIARSRRSWACRSAR